MQRLRHRKGAKTQSLPKEHFITADGNACAEGSRERGVVTHKKNSALALRLRDLPVKKTLHPCFLQCT